VAYEVSTEVFEGPFDLLLHLILREQIDLYEISLARIVDGYLAEVERMEALDLDVATEFLLIAATLVELKARRLLPDRQDVELDEELALWEERDLLLARLLECKTFKDAASVLRRLSDRAARSFPRQVGPEERFIALTPDLLEGITAVDVRRAFLRAMAPRPTVTVDLAHVAPIRLSVADAVAELVDELPRVGRITFRRLTDGLVERLEVIVRFLAVLELYKQGLIDLDQADTFGEIELCWLRGDAEADRDRARVAAGTIDDYEG
jgi:segregation and condensation protein A